MKPGEVTIDFGEDPKYECEYIDGEEAEALKREIDKLIQRWTLQYCCPRFKRLTISDLSNAFLLEFSLNAKKNEQTDRTAGTPVASE